VNVKLYMDPFMYTKARVVGTPETSASAEPTISSLSLMAVALLDHRD